MRLFRGGTLFYALELQGRYRISIYQTINELKLICHDFV
jgi:hypothetical protein